MSDQHMRITSAIEYTLADLRRGPKPKCDSESTDRYSKRCLSYFNHKFKFCLYAIRCLKTFDKEQAEAYLSDLRQLREGI